MSRSLAIDNEIPKPRRDQIYCKRKLEAFRREAMKSYITHFKRFLSDSNHKANAQNSPYYKSTQNTEENMRLDLEALLNILQDSPYLGKMHCYTIGFSDRPRYFGLLHSSQLLECLDRIVTPDKKLDPCNLFPPQYIRPKEKITSLRPPRPCQPRVLEPMEGIDLVRPATNVEDVTLFPDLYPMPGYPDFSDEDEDSTKLEVPEEFTVTTTSEEKKKNGSKASSNRMSPVVALATPPRAEQSPSADPYKSPCPPKKIVKPKNIPPFLNPFPPKEKRLPWHISPAVKNKCNPVLDWNVKPLVEERQIKLKDIVQVTNDKYKPELVQQKHENKVKLRKIRLQGLLNRTDLPFDSEVHEKFVKIGGRPGQDLISLEDLMEEFKASSQKRKVRDREGSKSKRETIAEEKFLGF